MSTTHKGSQAVAGAEDNVISRPMADRVEIWSIDRLIPSASNARTHSEGQVVEIAGSIAAFGFMVPMLVDREGRIIAGNGRVLAARKLMLERVPVIVADHLTDREKRAYAIADNKIALNADWDDKLLLVELEALKDDGIHLESLGFSEEEFNELMDQLGPDSRPDEDSVPDASDVAVCRSGDVWQLGEHLLCCGDALDAASYAAVLAGKPAAMTFTDPPYNVAYRAPGLGVGIRNDNLGTGFGGFLETACTHTLPNTSGAVYVCMSSSELHTLHSAFTKSGGHWSTFIIWQEHVHTRQIGLPAAVRDYPLWLA
jgi:hypothetical protein